MKTVNSSGTKTVFLGDVPHYMLRLATQEFFDPGKCSYADSVIIQLVTFCCSLWLHMLHAKFQHSN